MDENIKIRDRFRRESAVASLPYKLLMEEKRKQAMQAKVTDFFFEVRKSNLLIYSSQIDIEDLCFFVILEFKSFLFLQTIINYYYMYTNHY